MYRPSCLGISLKCVPTRPCPRYSSLRGPRLPIWCNRTKAHPKGQEAELKSRYQSGEIPVGSSEGLEPGSCAAALFFGPIGVQPGRDFPQFVSSWQPANIRRRSRSGRRVAEVVVRLDCDLHVLPPGLSAMYGRPPRSASKMGRTVGRRLSQFSLTTGSRPSISLAAA